MVRASIGLLSKAPVLASWCHYAKWVTNCHVISLWVWSVGHFVR